MYSNFNKCLYKLDEKCDVFLTFLFLMYAPMTPKLLDVPTTPIIAIITEET